MNRALIWLNGLKDPIFSISNTTSTTDACSTMGYGPRGMYNVLIRFGFFAVIYHS
jgi:hypothetical protein